MSQEPGASTKKPGDERAPCSVCGTSHRIRTLLRTTNLRPGLAAYLARGRDEGWDETARICRSCQAHGRHDILVEQLESERGQLSAVEREIADKAARHLTLAEDIEREFAATTSTLLVKLPRRQVVRCMPWCCDWLPARKMAIERGRCSLLW